METITVYIYECHKLAEESYLDNIEPFNSLKEAEDFVEKFNLNNPITDESDWYMKAVL